ncbi:hypothetical protein NKH18_27140 [Streptomyces sp. M10(2022)]
MTTDHMNHWFAEVERHTPTGITHEPTRRFLAEIGLPRTAALIRFGPDGPDANWPELHRIGTYGPTATSCSTPTPAMCTRTTRTAAEISRTR